jgi:hypothetical protein
MNGWCDEVDGRDWAVKMGRLGKMGPPRRWPIGEEWRRERRRQSLAVGRKGLGLASFG